MFNKREAPKAAPGHLDDPRDDTTGEPVSVPVGRTRPTAVIGPSIHVDGEIRGDEDLVVEGKVKGSIEVKNHSVTVGGQGEVQADIYAQVIYLDGVMEGQLVASEQVVVRRSARVRGSIASPRVTLEDGARFNGSIDMDEQSDVLARTFPGGRAGVTTASGSGGVKPKAATGAGAKVRAPDTDADDDAAAKAESNLGSDQAVGR
ncbi:bactofilin family protein [Alkalilimnicola ehrlichii MLHE-1]|uniref:Polymer-forming cytoskeletal protein n=1 Tax=Alkalilimnicola ehrlichii (strain ATCC BAA-1101 / DSM 17681 / MLHE-1) TaxID=187272 RepID=Q0A5R9_ALKEH|nr:polymer-forming cytoskeletal protein [Alkalilimnicola ehrlichii]ABI57818.1 protein of unknown function DUF583 [Alkalilimnicola ehrlichii MLHE-1]